MTEFAEDHYVSYDVRFTFSSLLAAPIAELLNRTLGYAELIGIAAAQVPDEALSTSIEEPLSGSSKLRGQSPPATGRPA